MNSESSGHTHDLYEKVKAYISPVTSAYITIAESNAFYRVTAKSKDNNAARDLLTTARKLGSEGKYLSAFHIYAKSLAIAEQGTELCATIFYYRAVTLDSINYYTEAIKDHQRIVTATNGILSETLRPLVWNLDHKLKYGPRKSPNYLNKLKPSMAEGSGHQTKPELFKDIHLQENRLIATGYIPTGTCLIAEEAACVSPLRNHSLFCHGCMNFSLTPVPCSGCTEALFCSEICRDTNWTEYHQYECKIISALLGTKYRLAVRMTLSLHDVLDNGSDLSKVFVDHDYIQALNIATSGPNISSSSANQLRFCAAQIFYLVKEYTDFFHDIESRHKYNIFKGILLKLMYVEETITFQTTQGYPIGIESMITTSFSVYWPLTNYLRHSCSPNASQIIHEDISEVRALRDIKPGEEITITSEYYHYTYTEREKRQCISKSIYFSECHCEACEGNWPLTFDLVSKHSPDLLDQIKEIFGFIIQFFFDTEILQLCYDNLALLSMHRNWNTPSFEWAIFEQAFRLAHILKWNSVHGLVEFFTKFPELS